MLHTLIPGALFDPTAAKAQQLRSAWSDLSVDSLAEAFLAMDPDRTELARICERPAPPQE